MSGFVVCPACGTRIKAGRGHCLRCFEPLPHPDEPVRPPIWESLGLSRGKLMMVGIGASLLVTALLAVIWSTWPEPVAEEAQPVAAKIGAPPVTPAPPSAAPSEPAVPDQADRAPAAEPSAFAATRTAELTPEDRASLEALRASYEQALAKTPDDPEALNNLGQTLARLNHADDAIARFQRAIDIDPDNARYHVNLARAAATIGQSGRAVAEYREAARILPQDYATRYTLALALQKNGDHEGALPEFERAIALAPAEAGAHLAFATSLEQLRRNPEAVREYLRYLDMRPTAPDADAVKARVQALRPGQP